MAGQGWRMLMECLAAGRSISLPATSAAGAKSLLRTTTAYARIRKQFDLPIGKMEGLEEPLARMVRERLRDRGGARRHRLDGPAGREAVRDLGDHEIPTTERMRRASTTPSTCTAAAPSATGRPTICSRPTR